MKAALPVIDLTAVRAGDAPAKARIAAEISAHSRHTGFLYVTGHGLASSLLQAQLDFTRRFFALPHADKQIVSVEGAPGMRGYEGIGRQTLGVDAPPDAKESFYLGPEYALTHPAVQAGIATYGPNQWPDDLPGFREQMWAYMAAMQSIEHSLRGLFALSLGLTEDGFESAFIDPMAALRLIHYPPLPVNASAEQLGAGVHTDWGMLTILLQDEIGGLEVCTAGKEWIAAPPLASSFVVNLGDMLARWTNGLYQSNPHRVRNNRSGRDRYSVAWFGNPGWQARVSALPSCVSAERPARFAPCTAGEHMNQMYAQTYGGIVRER